VGATLLYWLTAYLLRKTAGLINLAYTHAAVGTLLLTIALCLLLDGDTLLFALAGEAATLHLIARRLADSKIAFGGHALFACVGVLLLLRVIPPFDPETSLFSARALTDLWVVAVTLATAFVVNRMRGLPIYFLGGVIGLALVFNRELSGNLLYFALILEAFALFLSAYWLRDEDLLGASHVGYALLTIWLGRRLIDHTMSGTSLLNYRAAADALMIASGVAVWRLARSLPERRIYLLVSAAAFAGLMRRELNGNLLLITLTVEAVVLHWLARLRSDKVISAGAHLLMLTLGVWMAIRLVMTHAIEPPLINLTALTDLLTVGTALAICTIIKSNSSRLVYQLASHLAILAWFARELSPLENGQGYVTIAWGVYGAILLIAALRLSSTRLRQLSLGTLILVVGKLFVVDLSELETIWRVLLFMGFGAVFLLLSYYFPKLWKGEVEK
jgi:uncharacterized membrane protein